MKENFINTQPNTNTEKDKISQMNLIAKDNNIDFKFPDYKTPLLSELDLSIVNDNQNLKIFLGNLIEFLRLPKLTYRGIEDHSQRRSLRDKISQMYPIYGDEILTSDKMKLNKFASFPLFIQIILKDPVLIDHPEIKNVLETFPTIKDMQNYNNMTSVEKEFLVSEIENSGINLINIFKPKSKAAKAS